MGAQLPGLLSRVWEQAFCWQKRSNRSLFMSLLPFTYILRRHRSWCTNRCDKSWCKRNPLLFTRSLWSCSNPLSFINRRPWFKRRRVFTIRVRLLDSIFRWGIITTIAITITGTMVIGVTGELQRGSRAQRCNAARLR